MRSSALPSAALLAAAVALAIVTLKDWVEPERSLSAYPHRESQLAQDLEDLFSRVAGDVKLSVVSVSTAHKATEVGSYPVDDPLSSSSPEAIGSGFIIDSRGYILTNHHLVDEASKISVRLFDNRELDARLVQSDPASDIALLKVSATSLPALLMGDSGLARVGQWVLAIGSPFGLSQTVSAGIISALNRTDLKILPFEEFIQTDASINPGNSGGPLVNLHGEAIGINTAIYTGPQGDNRGIGFAVPITLAKALVTRWMEGKGACFLGAQPVRVDEDMARYYKLSSARGAFLKSVDPGGPAANAGLQAKDIILALDGVDVRDENHLRILVAGAAPGHPMATDVLRKGESLRLEVALGELAGPAVGDAEALGTEGAEVLGARLLGLTVATHAEVGGAAVGGVEAPPGVTIISVHPASAANKKGLRPGDAILEVDEHPIATLADLQVALAEASDTVMIRAARGGVDLGYVFLPR